MRASIFRAAVCARTAARTASAGGVRSKMRSRIRSFEPAEEPSCSVADRSCLIWGVCGVRWRQWRQWKQWVSYALSAAPEHLSALPLSPLRRWSCQVGSC